MDEQELQEQFVATDYDKKGNIKLPPPPVVAAKKKRITVAELNKAIDNIKNVEIPETRDWLGELDARLDKVEHELIPQSKQGAKSVWDKLDNLDAAIGALASALRSHLEDVAPTQPEPELELEFAQPPQQPAGGSITKGDIEAVAQVAQSMTDVLMICRALKAMPDIADEDRLYLLQVACRMAGEQVTGGLQIRAGMRNVAV